MENFNGQNVIITGATRGIGRAISTAFLDRGATVIGIYASNDAAAESLRGEQEAAAERLRLYRLDISDYDAVQQFYTELAEDFESIDVLVNNAGIRRDAIMAMMSEQDWQRVIDINLTGGYAMAKFAVPMMLPQRYGRIIFITSPMAHLGFAGQANYAASKAGQIGMMHSLAKEVARKKITVNCVSPGFIATELIDDLSEEQLKAYKKQIPARRFGKPEEVADAVLFLSGSGAAYITGSVLSVTGGI